jgi:hypothetical protein
MLRSSPYRNDRGERSLSDPSRPAWFDSAYTAVAWIIVVFALVLAGGSASGSAAAQADFADISRFFGSYQGQADPRSHQDGAALDLAVRIGPISGGFNVTWSTKLLTSAGESKAKTYSIDFRPSGRPNVFASQMRTDMFGQLRPMDPFKGEPLVWARISGDTMTVFALHILDSGSYEMQVYERTLAGDGLDLVFHRYGEGGTMREMRAHLRRVSGP